MKRTILLTTLIATLITTLLVTTVSAEGQPFEAPGAEISGDTLSVELDSHSSGWATLALPVNGEVPLDQITDDCDIQDGVAYGFEGQGTSTEMINGMRGYAIRLSSDCTAEIDTSSIDEGLATSMPDNSWTVISVPGEMSVSELESDCSFNGFEGTNIFEITLDEGNIPLDSTDTLQGTGLYWARVSGNNCGLDISNTPFETPSDGDDDSDDSSDDGDSDHDHTLGDLYFWDTEASKALVNTEAGNGYDGQEVEYNMYDGDIEGVFTWKNNDRVEHTLWVKNEHTGATQQTTSSSIYVKTPPSSSGETFGTNQYRDFYEMSDSGCTEFTVAVLPPGWDGSDSDVSYDAKQMNRFTFCPNSRGDDSDDSDDSDSSGDRSNEELGDLSFEIRPDPTEWTDDSNSRVSCEEKSRSRRGYEYESWTECEVDAEFEAEAGEGYIDGYKVKADINNEGWDNDPSPFSYTCEGPDWTSCYTSHTNTVDVRDIGRYSAWIEVQNFECTGSGRSRRCNWETVDRQEFSNFE